MKPGFTPFETEIYKSKQNLIMKSIQSFDEFLYESSATQVPELPQRVSDDSGGNSSLRNPRKENYKVTIHLEGRTPNLEFGATIEGVWMSLHQAAYLAHFKTLEFLKGKMDPVDTKRIGDTRKILTDTKETFRSRYPSYEEERAVTVKISNGDLEPDHFEKPGETSVASIEISRTPVTTPIGGYIVDSYKRKI
jgi:hypothetical protein